MLPWEHSEPPSSFAIYTEGGSVAIQSSMAAGKGAKRERYTEPSVPPLFSMPASLAYYYGIQRFLNRLLLLTSPKVLARGKKKTRRKFIPSLFLGCVCTE